MSYHELRSETSGPTVINDAIGELQGNPAPNTTVFVGSKADQVINVANNFARSVVEASSKEELKPPREAEAPKPVDIPVPIGHLGWMVVTRPTG